MGEIKATLDINTYGHFDCRPIKLKVQEKNACAFLQDINGVIKYKVAHGEGGFHAPYEQ